MTFEELEKTLPNGFHDARILALSLDNVDRTLTIKLSLHVSVEGDPDRERYRVASLVAHSVCLFFIECPDPNYHSFLNGRGIATSGASVALGQSSVIDPPLRKLPPGATAYRFFLEDWNSFLYLAATDATLSWEQGDQPS
jgi:hypothetical protein